MNVMTQVHPFLDAKAKRMLIGGKWLEAASGKAFETRNPATDEILANVAEGDAEDIDRAVAAAREAFRGRSIWARRSPARELTGIGLYMLRLYAELTTALHGETINSSLPSEMVSFTLNEPVGVVGAIIPWNGLPPSGSSGPR